MEPVIFNAPSHNVCTASEPHLCIQESLASTLARADIFEPVWSAVFSLQPWFTGVKLTSFTSLALWRIWAIEERDMIITNILEPAETISVS